MPAVKLYLGLDRRMLVKAKKLLTAMRARDARIDNSKPTSKLSNRVKIFQEDGSAENQAVDLLLTRIQTLLDTTKS